MNEPSYEAREAAIVRFVPHLLAHIGHLGVGLAIDGNGRGRHRRHGGRGLRLRRRGPRLPRLMTQPLALVTGVRLIREQLVADRLALLDRVGEMRQRGHVGELRLGRPGAAPLLRAAGRRQQQG